MVDFDKLNTQRQILEIVEHKHKETGGHCGVTPAEIRLLIGCDYAKIKEALNRLYKHGKISVHQGKDGKLVKFISSSSSS